MTRSVEKEKGERRKKERRKRVDLSCPYVQPGMDRRSGRDRRESSEFGGDLTKKFKTETNIYKRQIDKLLKNTDKLEEMRKYRSRESEDEYVTPEITFEIVEEKKYDQKMTFESLTPGKDMSSESDKEDFLKQTVKKIRESVSDKDKVITGDKFKTFGILLLSFIVPFYVASHIFQPLIFQIFPFLNVLCPALAVLGAYLAFFKS